MSAESASRRDFLKAAAAAGTLAALPNVHAAGSDMLRVGLIGCGDRGTGAATQALAADSNVKLVAMADAFEDRLQQEPGDPCRRPRTSPAKLDVKPDHRFVGFDAYQELLGSGVDVVLLCTPPHFRPHPPPRGGRGRQARLRREAGRRRCPRRPLRARRAASWPRRRDSRSSPASASATTTASARPSGASTTGRSATSSRSSPTTTAAAAGTSRGSPAGPTCSTRCATGTTSPGCRATSTSSSTSTTSTSAPG